MKESERSYVGPIKEFDILRPKAVGMKRIREIVSVQGGIQ